ncbi:signal peptide peptidase SppA [Kordiimonas sp. SCSIO 12610]|uniref:signal peptide peptidase SppA n=1 Tax=Kordiimonas sp. SCSIO 12610 TaxID=2829597 RepID=UPI00210B55EF|nr:signal peptide peptidase SppA [Kordiimonas sp. SCSIO 12610]UTW56538.1 signal peptide peptidase SppA [Kordiimonas sp. SCSIO 12610]
MKGVWKIINSLVKFIQGIGTGFLGILVIFLLVAIVGASSGPKKPTVQDGSVLVLWPSGAIVEQKDLPDAFATAFNQSTPETSFHGIIKALEKAKDDDRISALAILTDSMLGASPSHIHDIAASIRDFKSSGKKVYAISTSYSQSDYLLAAEADKIYMNGEGNVLLDGYGSYPLYYKSLYDKIEATVNVFKVGTYKSAVEPSIRDNMSDAAKEANLAFLNSLWDQYLDRIVEARGLDRAVLVDQINNLPREMEKVSGDFGELAVAMGLVDELTPRNEWRQYLMNEYGTNDDRTSFKQISHEAYLAATATENTAPNQIAVITAQGTIVPGNGPVTVAASETIINHIRMARKNSNTAAIVLRVDSPGGSAFASELIREELVAAQDAGIPVVASMGPVAASGGYWISATADEIWASPTTITGSIGIFAVVPTFEKTLEKIGVHSDGVGTTPLAGGFNPLGGLNDTAKSILQLSIENGYSDFLELVSKGRNMSVEDVDKIAQGRVWIGSTAKDLGLVDHLGNFGDAVAAAARLGEVENYKAVFYREKPSQYEVFLNQLMNSKAVGDEINNFLPSRQLSPLLQTALELESEVSELLEINDPMNHYILCLECKVQ